MVIHLYHPTSVFKPSAVPFTKTSAFNAFCLRALGIHTLYSDTAWPFCAYGHSAELTNLVPRVYLWDPGEVVTQSARSVKSA